MSKGPERPGDVRLVVGIGASAGGFKALEEFFATVRVPKDMTFLVVTHTSPEQGSLLAAILDHHASIPVVQVNTPCAIAAGVVYVPLLAARLYFGTTQLFRNLRWAPATNRSTCCSSLSLRSIKNARSP